MASPELSYEQHGIDRSTPQKIHEPSRAWFKATPGESARRAVAFTPAAPKGSIAENARTILEALVTVYGAGHLAIRLEQLRDADEFSEFAV